MTNDALGSLDRLIDAGITDTFNRLGAEHGLPPLAWRLVEIVDPLIEGTHPEGRAALGAPELCAQWAAFLNLREYDSSGQAEGYVTWSGTTPAGVSIDVHAITDVERYRAANPDDIV
ncbi:hypothetical protein [Leifsonia sp. fls2-241-R2A-40a]|uniref:hypothetical protein n=1 Tax=Leifsonia sp. fls2-241-R2A-40a TaxID=3040290 RepID=UPI00254EEE99|nr:hypothetical protein [Leifsonia sp. fls2-241-R2A-40a]